jgi:hypothetical protein
MTSATLEAFAPVMLRLERINQMRLQQQLDAFRAEFARTAPAGRPALYEAKIEELRAGFALERAVRTGDQAPDFTLPDPQGRTVTLATLLQAGPAIVTFYRGGWCPYCNIQLRTYQGVLPEITALGARLVAISPQLPDGSLSTAEANELTFLPVGSPAPLHPGDMSRSIPFQPTTACPATRGSPKVVGQRTTADASPAALGRGPAACP